MKYDPPQGDEYGILRASFGGHDYVCSTGDRDCSHTKDCAYGCGAWMGGTRSGAPKGINTFGLCPKNPLGFTTVPIPTDAKVIEDFLNSKLVVPSPEAQESHNKFCKDLDKTLVPGFDLPDENDRLKSEVAILKTEIAGAHEKIEQMRQDYRILDELCAARGREITNARLEVDRWREVMRTQGVPVPKKEV